MQDEYLSIKIPFDLSLLPPDSFLVGGVVRDAILNRQRFPLDLDFVLPINAVNTAKNIAKKYHAGFVVLDAKRQIARVVLKNATLDFAQREGDSLENDLRRRDFTINAIAYDPFTETIFDPLNGKLDLEKRTLKMISEDNLQDDPLRLLRAYRQAAQLNFSIENNTQKTIQNLAPLLKKVAPERIRVELDYLLINDKLGNHYLNLAYQDKLIEPWFKNSSEQQFKLLDKIDVLTKKISQNYPEYQDQKNWNYLAKITCLFSQNLEMAEQNLMELKYSRSVIRNVVTTLNNLPKLINHPNMSLRDQYFLFLDLKDVFPVFALLASLKMGDTTIIEPLLQRYFNPNDPVAHPKSLVTGHDLIRELKIKPSPELGKLLTEIAIAHIEGKIKTDSEALAFAKNMINK
jgi:tRNA nucleotidyltransferase (CCA-adding enzyme)